MTDNIWKIVKRKMPDGRGAYEPEQGRLLWVFIVSRLARPGWPPVEIDHRMEGTM